MAARGGSWGSTPRPRPGEPLRMRPDVGRARPPRGLAGKAYGQPSEVTRGLPPGSQTLQSGGRKVRGAPWARGSCAGAAERRALAPHVWTDRPEEVEGAVLGGGEPLISGGVGSSPGGLLGGGAAGGEGRDSESQAQRPAVPGVPPCLYPAPAVRSGSEKSWGVATAPSMAARLTDFLPWRMLALCCARLPRLVTRGGRALGMRLV